jgi:hypothetical protein
MEIWILIGILLASGFIGCLVCEAYENIQMNKWMRQRHLRELKLAMMQLENPEFFSRTYDVSADEIKRAMHTSGVTTTFPTGETEVLGPGKMEEMADELIKEARERCVGDIG